MKLAGTQPAPLSAWRTSSERDGTLSREFVFHDFAQARQDT
jgi:hypothetical protein